MIKLAIVEDEREHAQLLQRYLKNWSDQSGQETEIHAFEHGDAFLFDWEEHRDYTAVFLDIQMPKMDGMELARRIRQNSESVQIVFTTGISDYMQQGYEVSALHYLLKPLQEVQVHACMERICRQASKTEDWILLHTAEGVERVRADSIWWAEAVGHAAAVGLERTGQPGAAGGGANGRGDGRAAAATGTAERAIRLEVSDSLGALEAQLKNRMIKCHRSYLVSLSHIQRIEKADVVLDDGQRIPLSRRLYKQVNEAFIRHYQRGFEGT